MKLFPPHLLFLSLLAIVAGVAGAQTPDGDPPPAEPVCDGLTGDAHGLCTSYCEAMDCDGDQPKASDRACERVLLNFKTLTGSIPPCDTFACPCNDPAVSISFANIVNDPTNQDIQSCDITDEPGSFTIEIVAAGASAEADIGDPDMFTCSANDIGTVMVVTLQEAEACVEDLQDAAATAGVPCTCTGADCPTGP